MFEGITGSISYGTAMDRSDMDIVGWCIPPKEIIFPHLAGYIEGFGRQAGRFNVYQQHHVFDKEAQNGIDKPLGREYDLSIYNIVSYFNLCMENNPNMIDTLFLPQECVLYTNTIGNMVREKRHIFLHKGCYKRFIGYATSQLHKMEGSKGRIELIEKYGYDTKNACHLVRLLLEAEQILTTGDLDLRKHSEFLKFVRNGRVPVEGIKNYFAAKEASLVSAYYNSSLPSRPREVEIKTLLLNCLEEHYGTLDDCIKSTNV
jgi:predicted nucleotidyltransferase